MPLAADILARTERDFPDGETRSEVARRLRAMPGPEGDRVTRCVLVIADGNWERFERAEKLAHTDYRDVIMGGEYESPTRRRLRDLSKPFGDH